MTGLRERKKQETRDTLSKAAVQLALERGLDTYAGLDLHQVRHSAATHLGEAEVPLQLIMGKTRHKNLRGRSAGLCP
ncbi:tyrosine-type recombinase/integrase [Nonomuraea basaltis]|uniref:tyrosine-type recombinase/integrase n=1 Tax=Nonomuraea basaltis TaxID=2495887 RepID=UPI00110C41AB|nr:tyrosine-type recombinase/integrase [Nonomuraea basaltis]TMR89288.1 phage integrase family protein [Nonomuraea basaltis]